MDEPAKRRLEKAGWRFGDAADFLQLTPEEAAYVELKLALTNLLRQMRTENGWTQAEIARRVGSSQSRVAKLEGGDPSVSVDLLIKWLLALGVSRAQLGEVIGHAA